jgi:alkanesulfonate monooxygenase SsuD/methylene tetrahydromethanopterin reductase-like flavin-dependent oxidoreductase (luciferase family)
VEASPVVNLGMFLQPIHPVPRDQGGIYSECEEKIILADKLGFSEVWVGEHYSASTEPITNPLIFLASLIHRTKRIRLGCGTINLPNHHPAMVAGDIALFDHLSGGRLLFGVGPGGLATDHELFGTQDFANRGEATFEALEMIEKLWVSEPPIDIRGKYWTIKVEKNILPHMGVGRLTRPLQKPGPPVATSAVSPSSGSVRSAAQRGWGVITGNFSPSYIVSSHWKVYSQGLADIGREPDGTDWRVARTIVVTDSDREAEDYIYDPRRATHAYFDYLVKLLKSTNATTVIRPEPDMPDDQVTADTVVRGVTIAGSPKTVIEKLIAFREKVGPFGTVLISGMDFDGANGPVERRSMELLAKKVMPAVRRALTPRRKPS